MVEVHDRYLAELTSECGAALTLLLARGAILTEAYAIRRMMVIRVIQMLYRLCGPPR